jgi:signal transduction histidine kinase
LYNTAKLLKIAKLDSSKVRFLKEKVNLCDLLQLVKNRFINNENQVEISLDVDMNQKNMKDYVINGDNNWLSEAFGNLVDNAISYAGPSGKVKISMTKGLKNIHITIWDSGRPFKPEEIPYLFDRFYTTDESGNNHAGIGLNLAKLVLNQHFASIYACNDHGGAQFVIDFPLYQLK